MNTILILATITLPLLLGIIIGCVLCDELSVKRKKK